MNVVDGRSEGGLEAASAGRVSLLPRFLAWVGRIGFRILFRARIEGLERARNCPPGTVVIANHGSYLDAAALAVFLPFEVTFAIDGEIARRWWVRIWLGVFAAVPVSGNRASALKGLIRAVRCGKKVMIFPEGRISVTGGLMRVFPGALRVAAEGSGYLLPVGIDGAADSIFGLDPGRCRRWFPRITLKVGRIEPIPDRRRDAGWVYDRILSACLDRVEGDLADERLLESLYSLHRYRHVRITEPLQDTRLGRAVIRSRGRHRVATDIAVGIELSGMRLSELVYRDRSDCVILEDGMIWELFRASDPIGWDSVRRVILVGGEPNPDLELRLAGFFGAGVLRLPANWEGRGWGVFPDPWIPGRRIGEVLPDAT